MKDPVFFDIETGPEPLERLKTVAPEFDPEEVKLGNVKDPEKIMTKLVEAKEKHMSDIVEEACLHANYCRILMIGTRRAGNNEFLEGDERSILERFWQFALHAFGESGQMIGHYIYEFDLPIIVRRSWLHRVIVPRGTFEYRGRYVNWHSTFVDTHPMWMMGNRTPPIRGTSSLEGLAKYFGLEPKKGNGKDFHKWDREKQLEYLGHDLFLAEEIYRRLA